MIMNPSTGSIQITSAQWDQLCTHLCRDDGFEHVAFLIAGIRRCGHELELIVRETIPIDDELLAGGPHATHLELRQEEQVHIVNRAVREGLALVEVHNHPDRACLSGFSLADEAGFRETVPYMLHSLTVPVYGALVLERREDFAGAVWADSMSNRCAITCVSVVGRRRFKRHRKSGHAPREAADVAYDELSRFDRQVRAFGKEGQLALGKLRVAVVGLGGIGSIVVRQLARIGVRQFVLVDHDGVEETNLNRLDGGLFADALCNVPKTGVASRGILEARGDALITPHKRSIFHPAAIHAVAGCDLIIGGTDDVASRFALNDVALAYLRPFLDIATEIHTKDGSLARIGGRYTFTFPGSGCLLCARAIDAAEAAAEFVPRAVKERNRRDGYITGSEEPAPSVLPLNAVVASLAVFQVLMWATGVREIVPQVHFDGLAGTTTKVAFERNPKCDRCAELFGRGDLAGLESRYARWAA
jgi:molybdopterin/thiamine biosynthesis adenylyltransferase